MERSQPTKARKSRRARVLHRIGLNPHPVEITLGVLAAMGVNRGLRFLDTFGKVILSVPFAGGPNAGLSNVH